MAVTIRQVAEAAGVSVSAVSKVLHGSGKSVRVSQERAAQIREVARSMRYTPNALARNLRSSRTHTVGLVFENFWNISGGPLYYLHLLDGVASPLFNNHYRLTILPELGEAGIVESLSDGQLEGVVWCKMRSDEATVQAIQQCPIPIVALNARMPDDPVSLANVSCDNRGGMRLAVEHLWELGHRNILFVSEVEEQNTPDCTDRMRGFLDAVEEISGGAYTGQTAVWNWEFDEFPGWWAANPKETAIVCWTERAAGSILARAAQAGVNVPRQLSVVGFDSTQFCDTTIPRLTAVRQPIFEMAKCAGETLLAMIRGVSAPCLAVTFPCGLDVRESTAPPLLKAELRP